MYCVQRFTFGDLRHDAFDRSAPDKDFRVLVVVFEVIGNGPDESGDVLEAPSANALVGNLAEPPLDKVRP